MPLVLIDAIQNLDLFPSFRNHFSQTQSRITRITHRISATFLKRFDFAFDGGNGRVRLSHDKNTRVTSVFNKV